ncbi:hypothetical protein KAU88_05665 [Candidatus Bathyarchaeota archaeon]|nr:hypothetical protein [Candidatus Bathyarchaeota archaeon]
MPRKNRESYNEYMREYRRRKKDEFDRIMARMSQLDKKFLNNVLGSRPNAKPKKRKTRKKGRKK